ncbi:MAG: hypothetical protein KAJ52_02050, partial [Sedimentisphaerales bacterium]|nr:hypothetical protein [Sedimentisphaerales bacterium]
INSSTICSNKKILLMQPPKVRKTLQKQRQRSKIERQNTFDAGVIIVPKVGVKIDKNCYPRQCCPIRVSMIY